MCATQTHKVIYFWKAYTPWMSCYYKCENTGCVKIIQGVKSKKYTFWSPHLVPQDFLVKDEQVEVNTDHEGGNDDLSQDNILGGPTLFGLEYTGQSKFINYFLSF